MKFQNVKPFMDEDFLLENDVARYLYHEHAAKMPIIDYHNHLPPHEIALDHQFENITQIWLNGDHYKWRAMRANGIPEEFITGSKSDLEKFKGWAATVPHTIRNPLFHWTHLELKRYFDINELLSSKNAEEIFWKTSSLLNTPEFSTQQLLAKMRVEVVCTTDDPTDDLSYHVNMSKQSSSTHMYPAFRPDRILFIGQSDYLSYLQKLEMASEMSISNINELMEALSKRVQYFHNQGCRLSDHGLEHIFSRDFTIKEIDEIFRKRLSGIQVSAEDEELFASGILYFLAIIYHDYEWTMQFHLGALRNNNERLMNYIGSDVGCDSIGDFPQAKRLSTFLNRLDKADKLASTILYNLNPADNEVFATMAGNYNDGTKAGKIQWGSAWWFLDQKDGMEKQLNTLSNMGLLSRFIGMLTDSRSFMSFPRHEYFRRILCNLLGIDVASGLLPGDTKWLAEVIENICYHNVKAFLKLN